jgi:hypothetical protein
MNAKAAGQRPPLDRGRKAMSLMRRTGLVAAVLVAAAPARADLQD